MDNNRITQAREACDKPYNRLYPGREREDLWAKSSDITDALQAIATALESLDARIARVEEGLKTHDRGLDAIRADINWIEDHI